jgi:hypothetical protein
MCWKYQEDGRERKEKKYTQRNNMQKGPEFDENIKHKDPHIEISLKCWKTKGKKVKKLQPINSQKKTTLSYEKKNPNKTNSWFLSRNDKDQEEVE